MNNLGCTHSKQYPRRPEGTPRQQLLLAASVLLGACYNTVYFLDYIDRSVMDGLLACMHALHACAHTEPNLMLIIDVHASDHGRLKDGPIDQIDLFYQPLILTSGGGIGYPSS